MSGYWSACRKRGERTSRSRARFPLLKEAALMVAVTVACGTAGSMLISPLAMAIVAVTVPSPNRCRVRTVTTVVPGSRRYRPAAGT
jgi:hypothetical protein